MQDTDNLMKVKNDISLKYMRARSFTKGWHDNIKRWRKRYAFDHYDTDPMPGEKRYIDPSLTNVVDLAVGIMQSNEWIWRSKGLIPTKEEEEGASIIEKAVASFIDINADRYQCDLKFETNLQFVRDGGACLFSCWDTVLHDNGWETKTLLDAEGNPFNAKVYYELPLRIEVIDPLQIHLLPGGPKRWLAVVREEEMSVYDAEKLYEVELSAFKGKSQQDKIDTKGEFLDYWELAYELVPEGATDYEGLNSEDDVTKYPMRKKLMVRNAMLFNNEFVRPLRPMDGYNDIAYTVNFYNPASRSNSSEWHSVLSPLEHPVAELEDTTNMRKRLMLMYTGLPLVARTKSGKALNLDKAVGKIINLKEGEDLGFPEWRGTPPDVDKHLDFARSRIQQSGFSDVMYGEGPSSASGYGLSMLTDQNRIRLEPPISHLENLWTWASRKWIYLASQFIPNDYMELYGHIRGADFMEHIKGEDLDKYSIRCEIKPEFPNERVRQHAMAVQVAGIVPDRILMEEYLNIQQPDDARRMKIQELVESNPVAMQYAMMKELSKRAATGDVDAAMLLQKMQSELMGEPQGRPEEPMSEPTATGLQTQNGMPPEEQFAGNEQIRGMQNAANAAPQMLTGGVE